MHATSSNTIAQIFTQGFEEGLAQGYKKGVAKGKKDIQGRRKSENRLGKKSSLPKKPFDRKAPCYECGSLVHQLAGHPNANTSHGYLRGCLPCNTKAHSFAQCKRFKPGQKWRQYWKYYREGREGLAPGEYHLDPRETMDARDNKYNLRCMPLTQAYAKANPYPDEINFKPPGRNVVGASQLMFDPFWKSDLAWSNIGCFSNTEARVDAEELQKWQDDAQKRHLAIYESLSLQHDEGQDSAPTKEQQANWSSIHNTPGPVSESQIPLPSVKTEDLAHVRYRSTVSPTPSNTSTLTRRYSPYEIWPQAELEELDD